MVRALVLIEPRRAEGTVKSQSSVHRVRDGL